MISLFVHFLCLPKENEPKERVAVHSPLRCCPPEADSLCCSQKADASESREVYTPLRGTPPSRFSAFSCAARLCEMALKLPIFIFREQTLNLSSGERVYKSLPTTKRSSNFTNLTDTILLVCFGSASKCTGI